MYVIIRRWLCIFGVATGSLVGAWTGTGAIAAETSDPDEQTCAASALPTSRPAASGTPTEVTIGVRMLDLTSINDVDQTLTAEFVVRQRWRDPRLRHLEGCEVALTAVWTPRLAFINSGRLFQGLPPNVQIEAGGSVIYLQTFYGTLASYEKLEEFPFDDHVFEVLLTSANFPATEVVLLADQQFTGKRELLNISDWLIGEVTGRVADQLVHATGLDHSVFALQIPAERIQLFYLWKVFFPLCLIVVMSWTVFWLNPANFGPQIGLSATSMLTLIAFLFATTNMVPRLGYLTTFDRFLICCLTLVFLALIESLVTSYLVAHDRLQAAQRLDRISRILFPAVFGVIIAAFLAL